jgi:hypothetical protein
MSIPVLIEVYDEMRRLAIAGSAVAPGDFRLKKLIPPLEKSGEKVPVFAKVAQAVTAVVESNEKTASTALLELTTLVNAILYTQGETGAAGELKPLETTDLGAQATQAGARMLKPLLEALSSTGSGRMEVVRDAHDRGAFKDLRLVKPALSAIDDPYPEIGEFVVENILPLYGKAILPELRAKLDIKGRGGHVHRLQLIHRLDPEGSRELIQSVLNDGSKEMRVAAVECLGTSAGDLAHLMEHAKAKAKDVRAAALRALTAVTSRTSDVVVTLKKAIAGVDLELIVDRVKRCAMPEIQDYVLDEAEQSLATLLKTKDKKEQGAAISRLRQLVSCLDERKDAKAEAFLLKCFENAKTLATIKSEPSGADLNELVAHVLAQGTPTMQKQLVKAYGSLTGGMLSPAIFAARATMTPADFFKEFSPSLTGLSEKRAKKNSAERERAEALVSVLTASDDEDRPYIYRRWMSTGRRPEASSTASPLPPLDARWLDAAVESGSQDLVCRLARPDHPGTNKFLAGKLTELKKPHEAQEVLRTMIRIRHPGATEAVVNELKKLAKEPSHHYYLSYWYGPMIADLPRSALATFEALMPTLPDKMVDQLMESVLALKNKPDEA